MANPDMITSIWAALGGRSGAALDVMGQGDLPSAFHVSDLAAASAGAAALAVAELSGEATGASVDRRLASMWFGWSLRPQGWETPSAWDPIAGDYPTADGWIRLHTNAPHHRAAALRALDAPEDKAAVAAALLRWTAGEAEAAVVAAGGCAAEMRSLAAWAAHPQGRALAQEPLVAWTAGPAAASAWRPTRGRPLQGLKVLDLTRVLAGPVATRFLAGFGAEVLRIDPIGWDEPGVIPEVTLGKRCARLDLRAPADRAVFEQRLAEADVLVHGYRAEALERLGWGAAERRRIAPALVDVSLNAYGRTGPWAARRGFDSLVQMSAGIADAGMRWRGADKPTPLPVQALDHATGYLMAAAAVRGLSRRLAGEGGCEARLSLARTARLLAEAGGPAGGPAFAPESPDDIASGVEQTAWGPARRLRPPVQVEGAPMAWSRPAEPLGASSADWG